MYTITNLLAMLVIATTAFALQNQSHDSSHSRSRLRNVVRHRAHVHELVERQTNNGFTYLGCVTDGGDRLLTGSQLNSGSMTVDLCVKTCQNTGYVYAGLEYGNQCFCGNFLANNQGKPAAAAQCSSKCTGNNAQICGGAYRMSLYQSATIDPPLALGCYTDSSDSRTLTGSARNDGKLTIDSCINSCRSTGYMYAGLEYGTQCYCGNSLLASRQTTSGCTSTCAGDAKSLCGGAYRMNVYQVADKPPATTATSAKPSSAQVTTIKPSTTSVKPSTTSVKPSTSSVKPSTSSVKPSSSAAPSSSKAPVASASAVGVQAPPSSSNAKYVWAHHMVGNTYSYTPAIWADDIAKASANGIDGFALNMGRDEWEPARIADAYAAAEAKGNFKLFFSFDVSSLGCTTEAHADNLANIIMTYANSSAQAVYKNKVLVSTFAGENCNFGQSTVTAGWAYTKSLMTAQNTSIYLMPAIFSDPSGFKNLDWMDGEFNWNGGWPMTSAPLSTSSDEQYMSALGTKGYMAAISPAFFTYYGVNSYNKNWIYRGDDWLLARRMEQVIAMRNKIDMVEIISWNDYGESHYIGPIRADQPNSQGWTAGMDHQGWLSMIKTYSTAFKTGKYPTSTDTITLWSRPHPKGATATAPSNPRPSGWQDTDDNVYAFITIAAPATIVVTSGNNTVSWGNVPAGVSKFSVSSSPGSISAKITRSGKTIKEYDSGDAFQYTDSPADYNFNYFVGQA